MRAAFHLLATHKTVLKATVLQSLRGKFIGNVFGTAWMVLYPLLFLSMYALVFVAILKVRIPDLGTLDYVLVIFSGLVPFLAFSEAFGVGTPSIVANRGLIKNTLFPIELVVARDVIMGHATMGLGMVLVWLTALSLGHIHLTHLMLPVIYLLQIIMTLGIVWFTASLTLFFRDVQQAIPIIVLFLMMVSPIGYTDAMVPEGLKGILLFNPLSWLMHLYRSCLMEGVVPIEELLLFATFSLGIFTLGFRFISRLKPMFADYA